MGAQKFSHTTRTAAGKARARVALDRPQTLWFNTGTLCNLECAHCYILSSPTNDALVYLSAEEVADYLAQIKARHWPVQEIGFTGGEPFMNPDILEMICQALEQGYKALILTNAMRPMQRSRIKAGLGDFAKAFGRRLALRVSLDHWSAAHHDRERTKGSFECTLAGMRLLHDMELTLSVAGRMIWGESEAEARAHYGMLFAEHQFDIDARDPAQLLLFPEMDETAEVPEITTECWDILGKSPTDVMCAHTRMVVKHRGAVRPSVVSCTLLPYAADFQMGATLAEAERDVYLNHPYCAQFCVLGGGRCSG